MGESVRPIAPTPPNSTPQPSQSIIPQTSPEPGYRGRHDVVFIDGLAYNERGYRVCGVANQRGSLCGRIGVCPFHKEKAKAPLGFGAAEDEGGVSDAQTTTASAGKGKGWSVAPVKKEEEKVGDPEGEDGSKGAKPQKKSAAAASEVPRKSRFKVSWTEDEHRRFLEGLRIHGKGKWKQIAQIVKSRNANQCQSHAQKYFARQQLEPGQRKKRSIHDITDDADAEARARAAATNAGLVRAGTEKDAEDAGQAIDMTKSPAASNVKSPGTGGMTTVPIMMPLGSMAGIPGGFNLSSYGSLVSGGVFARAGAPDNAPCMQKMRVTVHLNGEMKNGKAMILPQTFDAFFDLATQKLNSEKKLTRVFTRMGGEISSLDEMCPDDVLWLSDGEDFTYPSPV